MHNYKLIRNNKNRKCRPETLLRLLISTSYPQACFAEVSLMFTEASGVTEPEALEESAEQLREVEKQFDMLDFVRCIEINKYEDSIKLNLKTLDFDPHATNIVDSKDTHLVAASTTIHAVNLETDRLEEIARYILTLFYGTQRKNKVAPVDLDKINWRCRTRQTNKGQYQDQTVTDTKPSNCEVIEMLKESLGKERFGIILTQNALLITDQRKRIWFDVR